VIADLTTVVNAPNPVTVQAPSTPASVTVGYADEQNTAGNFLGISSTYWLIGGFAVAAILLLGKKKKKVAT
jgi:hypothetical protein